MPAKKKTTKKTASKVKKTTAKKAVKKAASKSPKKARSTQRVVAPANTVQEQKSYLPFTLSIIAIIAVAVFLVYALTSSSSDQTGEAFEELLAELETLPQAQCGDDGVCSIMYAKVADGLLVGKDKDDNMLVIRGSGLSTAGEVFTISSDITRVNLLRANGVETQEFFAEEAMATRVEATEYRLEGHTSTDAEYVCVDASGRLYASSIACN